LVWAFWPLLSRSSSARALSLVRQPPQVGTATPTPQRFATPATGALSRRDQRLTPGAGSSGYASELCREIFFRARWRSSRSVATAPGPRSRYQPAQEPAPPPPILFSSTARAHRLKRHDHDDPSSRARPRGHPAPEESGDSPLLYFLRPNSLPPPPPPPAEIVVDRPSRVVWGCMAIRDRLK